MSRHKLFYQDPRKIRDALNEANDLALQIHDLERRLVLKLRQIDQRTWYVRYGFNSLSGFCRYLLGFTRTQTQRIATLVRRPDEHPSDERS